MPAVTPAHAVIVAMSVLGIGVRMKQIQIRRRKRRRRRASFGAHCTSRNEDSKQWKTISVICCALNEETTIASTIRRYP